MEQKTITLLVAGVLLVGGTVWGRRSEKARKYLLYLLLISVALIMLLPFYWMLVLSTQTTSAIYRFPPPFWFGSNFLVNLENMMEIVDFFRVLGNSAFISICYTTLVLLFCSMGGYAFAMYRFPGRNALFKMLLVTMMIPFTAGIVPWFFMITRFGWLDSYLALIIPGCANAFGIFWMRQYCLNNVPRSLIDAAQIDGCSEWLIFFRVITPVLLPAYSALGIMQFVNSWNDFLNPLMVIRSVEKRTLPLMLKYLVGDATRGTDMGVLMVANTMAVLPLLVVFLLASKYFMSGLTAGAIKE